MDSQIDTFPPSITRHEIAAALGVSLRTVERSTLTPEGYNVRTPLFSLKQVLSWHGDTVKAAQLDALQKQMPDLDGEGLDAAKLRLITAQAIGQEIKNAVATGELAPIDLLEYALGKAVGTLKNACEILPALCKRAWPDVPMHVLDEISRQTGKALNEIANTQIEFDHPAFTEPTETPAKPEETPAHE